MRIRLVLDYAVYLIVRLLICAVQALPLSVLERLTNQLGWFAWHVLKLRRKVQPLYSPLPAQVKDVQPLLLQIG